MMDECVRARGEDRKKSGELQGQGENTNWRIDDLSCFGCRSHCIREQRERMEEPRPPIRRHASSFITSKTPYRLL